MLDLVLWSFLIALTTMASGLAWRQISGVVDVMGDGLSRAIEDPEPWRSPRLLSSNLASGSISRAGKAPGTETGRSFATSRGSLVGWGRFRDG
jgi:hypothetical protein